MPELPEAAAEAGGEAVGNEGWVEESVRGDVREPGIPEPAVIHEIDVVVLYYMGIWLESIP